MKRLAVLALLAASCSPTHTGEVVVTKAATTTTLPKAHPRLVEMFKDRAARMTTTTTTPPPPVRVHAAAASPPTPAPTPAPPPPPPPPPAEGEPAMSPLLRRIGGCESSGRPDGPLLWTVTNKSGSTASGAFQILDSTWSGRNGRPGWKHVYGSDIGAEQYSRAMHAPPSVQTTVAERALAAQGTTPWNASAHCWG